jgi:alginate O-acetyltransferase complex protein AlgI
LLIAAILTFYVGRNIPRHWWLGSIAVIAIVALYVVVLARAGGIAPIVAHSWVVPLGMAYYTLRLIHYLAESGRGTLRPHRLDEYLYYHFLPPALPVGPIHRFGDFLRDLRRRRWDGALVSDGLGRILLGGCKIVLLATVLLPIVFGPSQPAPILLSPDGYRETLRFWLNLYVQFSGYSDLAIGAGAVMGFRLPENFNLPFLARNIGDFWRRWHMSLSSWCRDYVYMPVLAQWRSPPLAMGMAMLTLGLWHAVSLHYVFWGLYHGCGLILWRRFARIAGPGIERMPRIGQHAWRGFATILTIHCVIFSYPLANLVEALVSR